MAQSPRKNPFLITTENASKQVSHCSHSFYRPIYIVSRIFGLMPFSIAYHSNGVIYRPVVNKLDALWFLLAMATFISFIYLSFEFFISGEHANLLTAVSFVGTFFVFGFNVIVCLLAINLDMCFRFKFVNIFKKITTFDRKV